MSAARRNYGAAKGEAKQEAVQEDEDERTCEDMLQEIEKLDKEDVAATRRMVALAAETRDMGAKTAANLKDQGEQIERTSKMLTGMDESLKSLGGRLGSAFGWKRKKKDKKGKGKEGADGRSPSGSRPGTPSSSSPAAAAAASSSQVKGSAVMTARDRMNATRPGSGRAPGYRPGPKGAESEAAQAEIDENLDMINDMVLEMKAQAAEMGQELEKQNGALNKLDLQTTVNSEGVKSATKAISGRNWVGGLKKIEGKMQSAAASYAAGGVL